MEGVTMGKRWGFLLTLLGVFCVSCATIPTLEVRYQPPAAGDHPRGLKAVLVYEDARGQKPFLGSGAQEEFRNFPGDFYFTVMGPGGSAERLGLFQTEEMIQEAFTRALRAAGVEVLPGPGEGQAEIHIVLNEFQLDLVNRYWTARMTYEARLLKDGRALATQTVTGQAERLKLIGREEAETAVSEIFTDAVNKLDPVKLFRDGRLWNP
jgi:hypothetical protein